MEEWIKDDFQSSFSNFDIIEWKKSSAVLLANLNHPTQSPKNKTK